MATARIAEELALLRLHYTTVDHTEANSMRWFRVVPVRMPESCSPDRVEVVFAVTQGYPGAEPYGFYIPRALTVNGAAPNEHGPPHSPPFPGEWRFLSWSPVDWHPTADVQTGSNLWAWVRTFAQRLREGQ
jgi:hypothetical protein